MRGWQPREHAAGKAAAAKLGEKQRAVAVDLYHRKKHTIDEICKAVGISRPTLYKYVAAAGDT
jgi:AcrR family transcriptional regulator